MHDLANLRAGDYRNVGLTKFKLVEPLDTFPREILDNDKYGIASTLEILDLSGTGLSALPADFGASLPRLRVAFFSNCTFRQFPMELASCPRLEMVAFRGNGMVGWGNRDDEENGAPNFLFPPLLRWLILTDNRLTSLPSSIGYCERLEKCMLAGNSLVDLPDSMANCRNLALLRIAANQLEALPSWLLTMPKLAFLSFAGNPCAAPDRKALKEKSYATKIFPLPLFDWNDIEIHHVLGEGASGIISKGTIRSNSTTPIDSRTSTVFRTVSPSGAEAPAAPVLSVLGSSLLSNKSPPALSSRTSSPPSLSCTVPVAIKIFRGALTSDGTPYDEMAACLAAGQHVNLVQVHGQVRWNNERSGGQEDDQTNGRSSGETFAVPFKGGLIMELIPPHYRVLGQPPSFDSCTRDCFGGGEEEAVVLPVEAALIILSGVASAAAHLHARGIAHGDMYAHNILVTKGAKEGRGQLSHDQGVKSERVHAILSDFGAATRYGSVDGRKMDTRLEKLEVLAFGYLVEDVLALTQAPVGTRKDTDDASPFSLSVYRQLADLKEQCTVPNVTDRPTFAILVDKLAACTYSATAVA